MRASLGNNTALLQILSPKIEVRYAKRFDMLDVFFQITTADSLLAIPANALQNDHTLEVAPFEVVNGVIFCPGLKLETLIQIFRKIADMRSISTKRDSQ